MLRTYEVFTQRADRNGQVAFLRVGPVDIRVAINGNCTTPAGTAERAGVEAIKVYSDAIGDVFAVQYGHGFVVLRRVPPVPTPPQVERMSL